LNTSFVTYTIITVPTVAEFPDERNAQVSMQFESRADRLPSRRTGTQVCM